MKYIGLFENGKRTGPATLKNVDGSSYKGELLNEQLIMHGHGMKRFKDGSSYNGSWQNNKRHGQGITKEARGTTTHIGEWVEDRKHGPGTIAYADGRIYTGTWTNNKASE